MSLKIESFCDIEQHLLSQSKKYKVALVAPSDIKTLQAVLEASQKGLIELIIIGDEQLLIEKVTKNNLDISGIEILDFQEPYRAVETASAMAIHNEIDLIIKGKYHPSDFIEKLFIDKNAFCDISKVHHVAVCKTKQYKKFLFITDGFIHCLPDFDTKANIIDSTLRFANQLGLSIPKVAVLAAVEVVYKQMPATVDALLLQKKYAESADRCIVEGPLSFDIAIDSHAAIAKGLTESKVAGNADILIAPNIETANGVYKAINLFSDSQIGGVIMGGAVPVVVPLEIDSVQTRYNSILLGLIACSSKA